MYRQPIPIRLYQAPSFQRRQQMAKRNNWAIAASGGAVTVFALCVLDLAPVPILAASLWTLASIARSLFHAIKLELI